MPVEFDHLASIRERLSKEFLERLQSSEQYRGDCPTACYVRAPAYKIQYMAGILKLHLYPVRRVEAATPAWLKVADYLILLTLRALVVFFTFIGAIVTFIWLLDIPTIGSCR